MFVVWWLPCFVSAAGLSHDVGVRPGEDVKKSSVSLILSVSWILRKLPLVLGGSLWETGCSVSQLCWKGLCFGADINQPVKIS